MRISIHAPAKGATSECRTPESRHTYFNPRSREGSDILAARKDEHCFHFNPRSREGSDRKVTYVFFDTGIISIHAPAKGATRARCFLHALTKFQSTLPRRERLVSDGLVTIETDFNPRSREGSDGAIPCVMIRRIYFNPRSREGSDSMAKCGTLAGKVFQSTLPRRERPPRARYRRQRCDFNPRSREGSDQREDGNYAAIEVFQSTLPRRERRSGCADGGQHAQFQSTLPRRERR